MSTGNYTEPGRGAIDIDSEKSDSVDLTVPTRGIYVGVAGNIKLVTIEGETVTFVGVLAGSTIPVRCKQVFSTLTTATSLLGLY
jgi:hypothetical protein